MHRLSILAALLLLQGCTSGQGDKYGLVPQPGAVENAEKPNHQNSALAQMRRAVGQSQQNTLFEDFPPLPPPEIMRQIDAGVSDDNSIWNGAIVDATSFDTLAESMNKIAGALPKEEGEVFDAAIKSIMFQVNLDADIVKKASSGLPPSDADILSAVQHLVHGKTPYEIVSEAYRLAQQREARKKQPIKQAQAPGPASGSNSKPFDDLP